MRLLLFNPDTDLALQANHVAYTPKKGVEQMQRDLFPLMALFSRPGDGLLLPKGVKCHAVQSLPYLKDLGIALLEEAEVEERDFRGVVPWGWNLSVASRLSAMGLKDYLLPSGEELERHRMLSSRTCLEALSEHFKGKAGLEAGSLNLKDIKEVETLLNCPGAYVFKLPYSSSGKGLLWPEVLGRELLLKRASLALSKGGLLTAQRVYDKVLDLAMEFSLQDHQAVFTGYSIFKTNPRGLYEGNLCLSDDLAESLIGRWIPLEWLHSARETLLAVLSRMDYQGCLGVDMLIARDPEKGFFLVPLLEMNLRHTMGMVANKIHKRLLEPSSAAFLSIQRFASAKALSAFHEQSSRLYPALRGPMGLKEGFLSLSLEDASSEFSASLTAIPDATPGSVFSFLDKD